MNDIEKIRNMVDRYFKARYGSNYAFRAPETFDNALERWMLYICTASGMDMAEQEMVNIETHLRG